MYAGNAERHITRTRNQSRAGGGAVAVDGGEAIAARAILSADG